MADESASTERVGKAAAQGKGADREDRLSAALRANLRRRKAGSASARAPEGRAGPDGTEG